MKHKIAFDEAGNSGQNLMDPEQPVFVLASVHLSDRDAKSGLATLKLKSDHEAHFKNIKRSNSGQKRIVEFLNSDFINEEMVKLSIYHKPYMVMTKFVDLLIEEMFHSLGFDLYKNGANIAMANMLYTCIAGFCGEKNLREFLSAFVGLVRLKNETSVKTLYKTIAKLKSVCNCDAFLEEIDHLLLTEKIVRTEMAYWNTSTLDPAIPAFILDCSKWGKTLSTEFEVLHDKSKPIKNWSQIIQCLMAQDEPEVVVGYDRRTMVLPLKAVELKLCNSHEYKQVQVADILASAYAYVAKCHLKNIKCDFCKALKDTLLINMPAFFLWPSAEVDPEKLNTIGEGGIPAAEYIAAMIARQQKKRKNL